MVLKFKANASKHKAMSWERAEERYEAEQAKYEQKMTACRTTEQVNNYNADGQRILKEVQVDTSASWSFYIMAKLSEEPLPLIGFSFYITATGF